MVSRESLKGESDFLAELTIINRLSAQTSCPLARMVSQEQEAPISL